MKEEPVLVTGGAGFLGAFVVRSLHETGYRVRSLDLSGDKRLARSVLGDAHGMIEWITGDVAQREAMFSAAEGCAAIIHIAAMLTPACRDDPVRGASVNLIGALNAFEAAKRGSVRKIVYASTAAVFGPDDAANPWPMTHYGAFKLAIEGCARAYWAESGVASIGLRPLVLYGPGREHGPTAGVSQACRAAADGVACTIPFSGRSGFMHVEEAASCFERALAADRPGAGVYNCWGEVADVEEVAAAIRAVRPDAMIAVQGPPVGIPADVESHAIYADLPGIERVPLADGIARTIAFYERAAAPPVRAEGMQS